MLTNSGNHYTTRNSGLKRDRYATQALSRAATPSARVRPACEERDFSRGPGNFPVPFRRLSVCQVSLEKNHIGLEGTTGIHRAILMNCAAQAGLNSASEAEFSLLIRCGFYLVILGKRIAAKKACKVSPSGTPYAPVRRPLPSSFCVDYTNLGYPILAICIKKFPNREILHVKKIICL